MKKQRGFPTGFRRIVVDEVVYFFKVGKLNTEVRPALEGKKRVLTNWSILGMTKASYLKNRWTRGSDEFGREDGCHCDRCDMDMPHIRYSHVIAPGVLAPAIRTTF